MPSTRTASRSRPCSEVRSPTTSAALPSITGLAMPNSRSQPSEGSSVSSTPPVPTTSIVVLPATVSSAVSNPRTELALVSWIATTTAMPRATPSTVVAVRILSATRGRSMN